ncbi:terminase small subunit [Microvirga thermotolerans]|uniref:Terminase small subunit n=1 Tax=Microvirga thermotolerans TaxID=2651334 RepID=A0A5P9JSZ1_9HYPH|nr:terminase small subunit [Microvirga thermotolerans]QFU15219.1 terminase small subunit [Microvirga thermotolerans]
MAADEKRKRFVQEYLIDLNGTQAAIRAGYARSGAHTEANRLLAIPEVKAMIEEGQRKMAEKAEVTQEYVIRELKEVVARCMDRDSFNPKDANKALELLGKHIGMFKDEPSSVVAIQNNVGSNNQIRRIVRRIVDPKQERQDDE